MSATSASKTAAVAQRVAKKIQKTHRKLEKLQQAVARPGYEARVAADIQQKDSAQIVSLTEELKALEASLAEVEGLQQPADT